MARQAISWHTPVHAGGLGIHVLDRTILLTGFFFALGMGLAIARLDIEERRPKWLEGVFGRSTIWLLAAGALWAVACYRESWELAAGLASVLVIGSVVLPLRRGWGVAPLHSRVLALVGVASYGIYLWHVPILVGVTNRDPTSAVPVPGRRLTELIGLGLPLTLVIAGLTYWQVERRGLARRRSWSGNAPPYEFPTLR